jgi:hypothetical protein
LALEAALAPPIFKLVHGTGAYALPPGNWVVGSNGEAPIRFDCETVSPRHAMLRVGDTHVDIIDLGSDAGTALNDRPVYGLVRGATTGDRLRFGAVECELHGPPLAECEADPFDVGTPTKEVDTRAVIARVNLVRSQSGPPGPDASPTPAPRILSHAPPRLVLCVRDLSWANQIEACAAIHPDLRVELVPPTLVEWAARRTGPAVLLLDLDVAGTRAHRFVEQWRDGRDAPERTVLLTGEPALERDVPHAHALGARAWIPAGKSAILVVALARMHLGVLASRHGPAGPGDPPYSSR